MCTVCVIVVLVPLKQCMVWYMLWMGCIHCGGVVSLGCKSGIACM